MTKPASLIEIIKFMTDLIKGFIYGVIIFIPVYILCRYLYDLMINKSIDNFLKYLEDKNKEE